jgi:hypothetical protein
VVRRVEWTDELLARHKERDRWEDGYTGLRLLRVGDGLARVSEYDCG